VYFLGLTCNKLLWKVSLHLVSCLNHYLLLSFKLYGTRCEMTKQCANILKQYFERGIFFFHFLNYLCVLRRLCSYLRFQLTLCFLNDFQLFLAPLFKPWIILRVYVAVSIICWHFNCFEWIIRDYGIIISCVPHYTVMYFINMLYKVTLGLLCCRSDSLGQGGLIQEHHLSFQLGYCWEFLDIKEVWVLIKGVMEETFELLLLSISWAWRCR